MSLSDIEQIERGIAQLKEQTARSDALERLLKNADFKKIISEGYFKDEAIRLVDLKADPAWQKPEQQAFVIIQIDAIGVLKGYLRTIEHTGSMAKKVLPDYEADLIEAQVEEAQ